MRSKSIYLGTVKMFLLPNTLEIRLEKMFLYFPQSYFKILRSLITWTIDLKFMVLDCVVFNR